MKTQTDITQEKVTTPVQRVQQEASDGGSAQLADNRESTTIQRKLQDSMSAATENNTNPIQRKNNTGLPDTLKTGIENLSGYSMDDVKVHYNSSKPAQLQAHAYAQGTDIHLASGQEKHLPHEAWHVVQQKQGKVKPTMQFKGKVNINDDTKLEKEADIMGAKATTLGINNLPQETQSPIGVFSGGIIQRVKYDYKKLWDKNPEIAHTIINNDIDNYWLEAKIFEQALGAGLFNNLLAHKGADTMISKLVDFLGEEEAIKTFGSRPDPQEAGAIPLEKVREAMKVGNLREKMYMVYIAINSGTISREQERREKNNKTTEMEKYDLINKYLPRRHSVSLQGRKRDRSKGENIMKGEELMDKNANLSYREKLIANGDAPKFLPGEELYELDGVLQDSSCSESKAEITFEDYKIQRLALLGAGLSGTTDWYFKLARVLGFSYNENLWLRIAALGQLLVNRDHTYHEVMHIARTQGKIYDYPDELPIGYTTLIPFNGEDILKLAKKDHFPGDNQAEEYLKNNKIEEIVKGRPKRWVNAEYPD